MGLAVVGCAAIGRRFCWLSFKGALGSNPKLFAMHFESYHRWPNYVKYFSIDVH